MRKFELVADGSSRPSASKWRTCGVGGVTSALGVLKGWKLLKLREALTVFLDVQSVNPMLKTLLVGVPGSKSSN